MTAARETVRVRVKSRTGDAYYRGSRSWPATAWARAEVSRADFDLLSEDPWLDVVLLEEHESIEARERTAAELLEEARKEIVKLREEIAQLKEAAGASSTPPPVRRSRGAP